MKVSYASRPGSPDRANEDLVLAGDGTVVVLDGVSGWFTAESGCSHGTPWFVDRLGHRILARAADPGVPLPAALTAAIGDVAGLHGGGCDPGHPWAPAAAVAVLRAAGGTVGYAVLGDCSVVLDMWDTADVVTDDRLAALDRAARAPGASEELRGHLRDGFQRLRNREGGYWIASTAPVAGGRAVGGTVPRAAVRSAALLSDGVSCLVETYRASTWRGLLTTLETAGPEQLIATVRRVERGDPGRLRWPRGKVHDDATAAHCLLV